ncbi:AsnC family protein, partial [Micromonospora sp. NPDC005220]|uniref:AsnC family protein n=1 Tax=Micromonospora sp. NPDC005220 TaxID=3155589 RepID=UPI00339E7B10
MHRDNDRQAGPCTPPDDDVFVHGLGVEVGRDHDGSCRALAGTGSTVGRWLAPTSSKRTSFGEDGKIPVVDEFDTAIIQHLQTHARQTNRELARAVGIAPSTCLERVR